MAGSGYPPFQITCTSEKFGAVQFDIVGLIASRMDSKGEIFGPGRTYDDSMKWIFAEIEKMRKDAPDFRFVA